MHIHEAINLWGNLLSPWVNAPACSMQLRRTTRHGVSCATLRRALADIPRPHANTMHSKHDGDAVHFDSFHVGETEVAGGVDTLDSFNYLLVILEDISGHVWLLPARTYMANFAAQQLVDRYATFGTPITWVSDHGMHFRNHVGPNAAAMSRVQHLFGVAKSSWTDGMVERRIQEVIATAKVMQPEKRCLSSEWVTVLPAVQWTLGTAVRQRLETSSCCVLVGLDLTRHSFRCWWMSTTRTEIHGGG